MTQSGTFTKIGVIATTGATICLTGLMLVSQNFYQAFLSLENNNSEELEMSLTKANFSENYFTASDSEGSSPPRGSGPDIPDR